MKICFLIPSLVTGGAERVITHMANYWSKKGNDVTIITLDHPRNLPSYNLPKAVSLKALNLLDVKKKYLKPFLFLKQMHAVRATVNFIQPEVLIAFLDITIFIALAIKPFIRAKVIVSERSNPYLSETNFFLKKANHFLYRYTDQLVLQTQQIAQTFPDYLKEKITVIHNPVVQSAYQLSDDKYTHLGKTIVSMGRLKWLKGYDLLINAFSSVSNKYPDWSLIIIGEGEEGAKLEQLCKEKRLEEKVQFIGQVSAPEEIMKKASIYVLASRFEGFPNALCEAMAIGLSCIATRCPFGPEEIIEDKVNGLLIDVDDEHGLQQALIKLMTSSQQRKQLGEEAKKISKRLSPHNVMKQWENVIDRILP